MREKIKQKIKLLGPSPNNYVNEVMKSELRVLSNTLVSVELEADLSTAY